MNGSACLVEIPSSFSFSAVEGILSLRGPKLTFRKGSDLWVVLAGASPRAWHMKVDRAWGGGAQSAWSERRPPVDDLLQEADHFSRQRHQLVTSLRSAIIKARASGHGLSNADMLRQRKALQAARKFGWLAKWLGYFPQEALSFLNCHHFETQRWHLLNLWLRVPRGRELFEALPALAWMLSASWRYKLKPVQRPLRSLRTLVTQPRLHILRWLDLPGGEGTLRLLGQYRGNQMNKRIARTMCLVLRNSEKRQWWQNLSHPPDYRQLSLIAYDMPVSFDLLRAMNEAGARGPEGQQMGVAATYRDCMGMIRHLNDLERMTELGRIRSPNRLRRFHDKLVELIHRQPANLAPTARTLFTIDSPLEVPPWLHPVCDYDSLVREGLAMNHCADSYSNQIARGGYYVYAVHHPLGRATLGIQRISRGQWEFSQLQGPRNTPVPAPVQADVRAWLRHAVPPPTLQWQAEFDFLSSCGPDAPDAREDDDIPF